MKRCGAEARSQCAVTSALALSAMALALGVASPAQASPNYGGYLQERFNPDSQQPVLTTCVYCHATLAGGAGTVIQPFGVRLVQLGNRGGFDTEGLGEILDAIEESGMDEDSDADRFDDLLELRAGSDPSDPTSRVRVAPDGSLSEVIVEPSEGGCSVAMTAPGVTGRGAEGGPSRQSAGTLVALLACAVCFSARRRKGRGT